MASSTSMTRKSFTRKMPRRIRKKTRIGLRDREAGPEKLKLLTTTFSLTV